MGVVHYPVTYRICKGGITNDVVLQVYRKLTCDDGRADLVMGDEEARKAGRFPL